MLGDAAWRRGWTDHEHFSWDPLYFTTTPYWTWGDPQAAKQAMTNSEADADLLLRVVGDSHVGYTPGDLPDDTYGDLPTANTCFHSMELTALLRVLRQNGEQNPLSNMTILEVGGGYGNTARLALLAYGFRSPRNPSPPAPETAASKATQSTALHPVCSDRPKSPQEMRFPPIFVVQKAPSDTYPKPPKVLDDF